MEGELLVVSQFTLYRGLPQGKQAQLYKGRRSPDGGVPVQTFYGEVQDHVDVVEKGRFGADMKVELLNDGPFTLMLDSQELFGE